MLKPTEFLTIGFLVAAAPALAQFKCMTADGKAIYQQTACQSGSRSEKIDMSNTVPADPSGATTGADSARRKLLIMQQQAAISRAVTNRYPIVGMTVGDLNMAMGAPDVVNSSDYGRGLEQQAIYYRGDRTLYAYTRAGLVTAVQDTAGSNRTAARTNCPDRQAMDNEAVSLNSITLGSEERDRRKRELGLLRQQCG